MAKNKIKSPKKQKAQANPNAFSRVFASMLDGSILTKNKVASMLPFFLYLTFLAFFLIFNTYYAEKQARELEVIRHEIVELRVRYITTKSELMYLSNQSEIARRLHSRGFVESTVPPRQVYDQNQNKGFFSRWFDGNN